MKVSIIVPVYKVEKYISRCIESLINQTYTDLEILLIDDGSPDNSGKICEDYATRESRIRVFHNENHGVSYSRNFGIRNATGEAITFVDSDDYIERETIEKMVEHADADMVALNGYYIDNNGRKTVVNSVYSGMYSDEQVLDLIRKKFSKIINEIFFTGTWGKLYKTNIIKENGIKFADGVTLGEDSIFVINYMLNCNSVYCEKYIGYNYVRNDDSLTNSSNVDTADYWMKFENYLIELEKVINSNKDRIDLRNEYLYDKIKCMHGSFCKEAVKENGNPQVIENAVKNINTDELLALTDINIRQRKMLEDFKEKRFDRFIKREHRYYKMKNLIKKILRK